MVLGFIVIEARDMAQAVDLAGRCPIAQGSGAVEIRPVMSLPISSSSNSFKREEYDPCGK